MSEMAADGYTYGLPHGVVFPRTGRFANRPYPGPTARKISDRTFVDVFALLSRCSVARSP